jgi:hypothetical protein
LDIQLRRHRRLVARMTRTTTSSTSEASSRTAPIIETRSKLGPKLRCRDILTGYPGDARSLQYAVLVQDHLHGRSGSHSHRLRTDELLGALVRDPECGSHLAHGEPLRLQCTCRGARFLGCTRPSVRLLIAEG